MSGHRKVFSDVLKALDDWTHQFIRPIQDISVRVMQANYVFYGTVKIWPGRSGVCPARGQAKTQRIRPNNCWLDTDGSVTGLGEVISATLVMSVLMLSTLDGIVTFHELLNKCDISYQSNV